MGVAYGGEEVEANRWVWLMEGRRWRLTGGCGLWRGGGGSQPVGVAYGGEEVEADRWVWGVHLMEGRAGRWKSVHLKEGGGLTGGGG